MMRSNTLAEREALEQLAAGCASRPSMECKPDPWNHATLFVGQGERHLLRAYRHGMARCLSELAAWGLPERERTGWVEVAAYGAGPRRSHAELCEGIGLLLGAWPLGRELRALLGDFCLHPDRAPALSVDLARMALRLAPSFDRRIRLIRALNQHGLEAQADALVVEVAAKSLSPAERVHLWLLQGVCFRDRGRMQGAHAASRAAVSSGPRLPLAWAHLLLTSALVGAREELREAGHRLAAQTAVPNEAMLCFLEQNGGSFPGSLLPPGALEGLPKIAQRILWECFSGPESAMP